MRSALTPIIIKVVLNEKRLLSFFSESLGEKRLKRIPCTPTE